MIREVSKTGIVILHIGIPVKIERDGIIFYAKHPIIRGLGVEAQTEHKVRREYKDAVIAYIKSLLKEQEIQP